MEQDRTELTNLADQHPELVRKLADQWAHWAREAKVKPWPWERRRRKRHR